MYNIVKVPQLDGVSFNGCGIISSVLLFCDVGVEVVVGVGVGVGVLAGFANIVVSSTGLLGISELEVFDTCSEVSVER